MDSIKSKSSYESAIGDFRSKVSFINLLVKKTLEQNNIGKYRAEAQNALAILESLNKEIFVKKKGIGGTPVAISYQKKYIDFCQEKIKNNEKELNLFLKRIQDNFSFKKEKKNKEQIVVNEKEVESRKQVEERYSFTLRDISFDANGFYIAYNEDRKYKIKMTNCNNALNEVRDELFKNRGYQGVLVFTNNKLDYEKSNISKLKSILFKSLHKIKLQQTVSIITYADANATIRPINDYKVSVGEITIDKLSTLTKHNQYLKAAASIIKFDKKDVVWGVKERYVSTDTIEDALLFIYYRSNRYYVLWENINDNRGGVMFMNIVDIIVFLERLKKYLKENKEYKRLNLRKHKLPKEMENMNLKQHNLNHNDPESYKCRIKALLNEAIFEVK